MGGYLNYMDAFVCGNLKQIKIYFNITVSIELFRYF